MYRQEKSLQEKERERAQVMMGGVVGGGFWVRGDGEGLEGVRHRLHGELIASQDSIFVEVVYVQ